MTEIDFSPLVGAIVTSYSEDASTRHVDSGSLPDRDSVIELLKQLRELIYPGYFGKQDLDSCTLENHVGELLESIHSKLHSQIRNALVHRSLRHRVRLPDVDGKTQEIVLEFLGTLPRLRAILATDVAAAFEGDPAAGDTDEIIFSYPGLLATTIQRIAHELHLLKVPLIPRIMTEYAHSVTGIDIHPGATLGEYFFIDHGTGVVIGETTTIGRHVKLYQGVTLGALSTRGGQTLRGVKRHPTLQDDVTVYSGASILGGETVIGQGAVIASNVFITQSVPAHTRVSTKNPELQYKNRRSEEFVQEMPHDWVI
ncbi:serine O-acetyltransferase [Holophaga foetida]|uniref:serine O-acetyltransferase n=1 Tax=Holophaga foetida TaxID=35839 RepID=UPI0002473B5E|nr:serine acetyltransferase [Holophaga foetida]